ncbi:MAG: GAF domain-containing protein, partial [Armatimonadota bacterium]|nr:GAF domain-containing protein [Armatimonadota bacterium]
MNSLLERIRGGLRQMHWLSLLTGVLLFALLNLLLALFVPSPPSYDAFGRPIATHIPWAQMWVNLIAAVLSVIIAPYLLRTVDRMQQHVARQNTELKSLRAIDNALNSQLNLAAILEIAVKECTLAVDGEMGALWLLDPNDPARVEARQYYNVAPARQPLLAEHVKRSAADARRTGLPVRRAELDATWAADRDAMLLKLRSAITVPVRQQEQTLALLTVGNRSTASPLGGFTDDDEALLIAIASSLSVAIQNARLYEETQRRGELLRNLVARTGEAIAASSDAPRLMNIFAGEAARVVKCPRVAVYSYVEGPPQIHPSAQTEFQPLALHDEQAGNDSVPLDFQKPLRIDAARLQPDSNNGDGAQAGPRYVASICAALGLRPDDAPLLNAPGYLSVLRAGDRRDIGLLCLLDNVPRPPSADRDAFAQALAAQAAVALENARLGE